MNKNFLFNNFGQNVRLKSTISEEKDTEWGILTRIIVLVLRGRLQEKYIQLYIYIYIYIHIYIYINFKAINIYHKCKP